VSEDVHTITVRKFYVPLQKAFSAYEFGQDNGELATHAESLPVPPEFDDPIVIKPVIKELYEILKANSAQYFQYEIFHTIVSGVGHITVQRSNALCGWRQA
jgi:hypothetical protein